MKRFNYPNNLRKKLSNKFLPFFFLSFIIKKMKLLIFSDIDGTFLNHSNYSYGNLKKYLDRIKNNSYIIFNTSKTFSEVFNLSKKLELKFPFIVENGACIFFPKNWLKLKIPSEGFFKYKSFYGYKLSKYNSKYIKSKITNLKNNYKFSFYSELNEEKIKNITNLKIKEVKRSKQRMFTDPILWEDTDQNIIKFKEQVLSWNNSLKVFKGGRFLHISDYYDKTLAMQKFISLTSTALKKKYISVSLGDSENDIGMLENSDYSCIVKNKNCRISIKKENNVYFSKNVAPEGWSESIDFVLEMEKKNF
tara:strand:+ start:353 stop:1270 length:918 start_codon:yes stop_codon:yes gene_type:complete